MSVTHLRSRTGKPGQQLSAALINFNDVSEIEEGLAVFYSLLRTSAQRWVNKGTV